MKQVKVNFHVTTCWICFQMESRGYSDECDWWDDFFDHKEKPVQYELVYKGNVVQEPEELIDS